MSLMSMIFTKGEPQEKFENEETKRQVVPDAFAMMTLERISGDEFLHKILVLDLCGTMRCTSSYNQVDNLHYGLEADITFRELLAQCTGILHLAQFFHVDLDVVFNSVGSASYDSEVFLTISQLLQAHLVDGEEDFRGAIIIHGTDTIEETLFGVDLTVSTEKPIVGTGSMRPSGHISFDGSYNLYSAVNVVLDEQAKGRGAMLVFSDRITSAHYGTKIDSSFVDAFGALEQGHLGRIFGGQPLWYYEPSLPAGRRIFVLVEDNTQEQNLISLPKVSVLYAHQGFDAESLIAALDHGAKGIVLIGTGTGHINRAAQEKCATLRAQDIPVVVSIRPSTGAAIPAIGTSGSVIHTGLMCAVKARIQLQLCLATGMDWESCRDLFEGGMRRALYNGRTPYYTS